MFSPHPQVNTPRRFIGGNLTDWSFYPTIIQRHLANAPPDVKNASPRIEQSFAPHVFSSVDHYRTYLKMTRPVSAPTGTGSGGNSGVAPAKHQHEDTDNPVGTLLPPLAATVASDGAGATPDAAAEHLSPFYRHTRADIASSARPATSSGRPHTIRPPSAGGGFRPRSPSAATRPRSPSAAPPRPRSHRGLPSAGDAARGAEWDAPSETSAGMYRTRSFSPAAVAGDRRAEVRRSRVRVRCEPCQRALPPNCHFCPTCGTRATNVYTAVEENLASVAAREAREEREAAMRADAIARGDFIEGVHDVEEADAGVVVAIDGRTGRAVRGRRGAGHAPPSAEGTRLDPARSTALFYDKPFFHGCCAAECSVMRQYGNGGVFTRTLLRQLQR
eukprot:TRINITY_DN22660_c0_g1_i1.p1 TRINITY_DN22660_c0_g1~~TRINITY_DN22660_c0_g1_i1.p1  ORF type:complete len:388 (+),score=42.00 TRINITY_DN22660_c0_g1_i1:92-1255(+)